MTVGIIGNWLFYVAVLQTNENNSTSSNFTNSDATAFNLAFFTSIGLELLTIAIIPLILWKMFKGQEHLLNNEEKIPFPYFLPILILAKVFLLAGDSVMIVFSCYAHAQQNEISYSLIIAGLLKGLHCFIYILLTFSALFISESLMAKLMLKCSNTDASEFVTEVKRCLQDYNVLRSNLGPMLLMFMSIDSLLVMLNSFMIYLACRPNYFVYFTVFVFWNLNGMLSLIYICIFCDDCYSSVKCLLVPIR